MFCHWIWICVRNVVNGNGLLCVSEHGLSICFRFYDKKEPTIRWVLFVCSFNYTIAAVMMAIL